MKTLADLKRKIQKGAMITLVNGTIEKMEKYYNIPSKILRVQTNGFYIEREKRESWIEFAKENQYEFTDKGFIYRFNGGFLQYEI